MTKKVKKKLPLKPIFDFTANIASISGINILLIIGITFGTVSISFLFWKILCSEEHSKILYHLSNLEYLYAIKQKNKVNISINNRKSNPLLFQYDRLQEYVFEIELIENVGLRLTQSLEKDKKGKEKKDKNYNLIIFHNSFFTVEKLPYSDILIYDIKNVKKNTVLFFFLIPNNYSTSIAENLNKGSELSPQEIIENFKLLTSFFKADKSTEKGKEKMISFKKVILQ